MSRYITRAVTIQPDPWTGMNQHLSGEVVICDDLRGVPTGLVDAAGVPIVRLPDAIGFDLSPRNNGNGSAQDRAA